MSEKARKGIVFGALIIAIIWGANQFMSEPETKDLPPSATTTAAVAAVPKSATLGAVPAVEKSIDVAEMKNRQWGDDPFRALVKKSTNYSGPSQPQWKLSGIVYNKNNPLAVINGKSVNVGDKIGDTEVIEIGRKSVILERNGARFTLTVSKG